MKGSYRFPHEVSAFIYIFCFLIVNVVEIQMGIFPTCQNHLNCRKKLLLLYIALVADTRIARDIFDVILFFFK